jgi:hypothetical protein
MESMPGNSAATSSSHTFQDEANPKVNFLQAETDHLHAHSRKIQQSSDSPVIGGSLLYVFGHLQLTSPRSFGCGNDVF